MDETDKGRSIDRGFWVLFVGGWIVYGGLVITSAIIEDQPALSGVTSLLTPALLATILALRRRVLLNPAWSLIKTFGIHLAVGIGYAVTSGLSTAGLLLAFGLHDLEALGGNPWLLPVVFSFYYVLLYSILAGFMMWTESIKRVQESQSLLAREAVLRAEAEAKAVRAQFNPHFVFNTLHSLILLVRADPKTAEGAIEDVAALIRYASVLDRRDLDLVPLGQELEIAKRYMSLEALRLSHRMTIEWDIDSDLETVPVPPFSLQTLLENAIKHGIAPKEEGGSIKVQVRREPDLLVISVEDDGLGARPEMVREAKGKGLNLLQRRVATLFGDSASLTWRTSQGNGFSVQLEVPITRTQTPDLVRPSRSSEVTDS